MRSLRHLLSICLAAALLCVSGAAPALAQSFASAGPAAMVPLGFNLTPPTYYNPCPFIEQTLCGQRSRASAATSVVGVPLSSQSHNYTLRTDASVKSLKVGGVSVPIANGVATFDAAGTPGHGTTIALVTPTDPPVSIIRTDWVSLAAQGETFSPDFLNAVASARGFRFMDWNHTNDTTATSWTPANAPTFNGVIVPVEIEAALSARTGADMWLNIPASMPMTEAARVVGIARNILPPTLKLHVEWSNEVWNTAFAVGKTAAAAPGGSAVYYGSHVAELQRSLAKISGVDVVICWQYTSSLSGKQKVIDAFKAAGGDLSHVGGFCVAPYPWNSTNSTATYLANNDQAGLLADMAANESQYAYKLAETVNWAKAFGIPVFFYETGLSPMTRGTDQQNFGTTAARTPAGAAIFRKLLADADAAGVSERYAFITAAQAQFGFYPDYDADPFPIGKVWQEYNRRAWPAQRAQPTIH